MDNDKTVLEEVGSQFTLSEIAAMSGMVPARVHEVFKGTVLGKSM
ncbi:MAG TPA: hypothetical protein VJB87_00100 [Candidatus Nanoarchaeia archaeon]|nr:hypothetical protein [Candidatus Nanoarchaeia archaeon]